MMYLNELLSIPTLQELTLINQNACLDRPVATIESTETPDVISYVPKNCFIITTAMAYKENQEKLCELILSLDKLPCAGLGIKLGRFIDELDPKVIQTADSVGFPLINIPIHLTLGEVYHRFLSLLWNVENDNLVDALNTQKQLYNLIIQGVPLRQVLKLISAKLNEPCLIVDRFGELCESVNTTEDEVKAAIAHIDGLNKDDNETICCSVRLPNYVKEVKLYIYPIKSIRRNSHFMVAFSREATSPLSFFVMEEVLLNLGMLFYKQLFTDLELTITYSGRMLTPVHFGMTPKTAPPGKSYTLRMQVVKGQKKVIGRYLNTRTPGGPYSERSHNILMGTGNTKAGGVSAIPFQRMSRTRTDIKKFTTISVPSMITSERTNEKILKRLQDETAKRLQHNLDRALGK